MVARASVSVRVASAERRAELAPPWDLAGLRPYQATAARWLATRRAAVLGDDMRLGKTAMVLRSLPAHASALVVAPAIARAVWMDEALRWRPDLRARVGLAAPARGELVITHYEALPPAPEGWTSRLLAAPLAHATLVLDEVHVCMHAEAARTVRARLLGAQCARVIGLTGTPLVGQWGDLYGVLVSCGLGAELRSEEEFCASAAAGAPWIRDTLRRGMLRRTLAECYPDLPPTIEQTIAVETSNAELRAWLDRLDARWSELGRDELPPFELFAEVRRALASARIPAATEHARAFLRDGPLVISSAHRAPVVAMGRALRRCGVIVGGTTDADRAAVLRAFRAGALDAVALTVDTGGVAIDLSRATRILEVDQDWSPGINRQLEARCRSTRATAPLHIVRLVSDHPLDQHVLEILRQKEERLEQLERLRG